MSVGHPGVMQFSPLPGVVLFDYAHWSFAKATNNLVHHRKSLGRRVEVLEVDPCNRRASFNAKRTQGVARTATAHWHPIQ